MLPRQRCLISYYLNHNGLAEGPTHVSGGSYSSNTFLHSLYIFNTSSLSQSGWILFAFPSCNFSR